MSPKIDVEQGTLPTLSVVIVDDEKDILTVLKHGLEKVGLKVEIFTEPKSALQHIECADGRAVNLVVSDIRMPGMSGVALTKKVKKLHPQIGVILMTAFEIDKKEFDKVMPSIPVDGFLTKPFTIAKLQETIAKYQVANFNQADDNKRGAVE